MIKPITTECFGYKFRSRLEARWAHFFNALCIPWEYEKEGYILENGEKYLPDFWIPLDIEEFPGWGYWVEIKPNKPSAEEIEKARLLAKGTQHTTFIFWGNLSIEDWHATVIKGPHSPGEIYLLESQYRLPEPIDDLPDWMLNTDALRENFWCAEFTDGTRSHHTPFGHYLPIYEISLIKSAFKIARSARFEYDQYTPA